MIFRILYKTCIFLLILFVSPLLITISLLIYITTGFPVLFRQSRMGKNGRIFILYKFRTMKIQAESMKSELLHLNEAQAPVFKIHNDPRFTTIGTILSHTGLDELPQLFNVFQGTMGLIGPRPLPISEAQKLKPWQQARHAILPGIVSPWIFEGYHETPFDQWMKSDISYCNNKSLASDFKIFLSFLFYWYTLFLSELHAMFKKKDVSIDKKLKRRYT